MEKCRIRSTFRLGGEEEEGILRAGFGKLEPDSSQSSKATDNYVIGYVFRGAGSFIDDSGRNFIYSPGDVFQRFPGVVHTVTCFTETCFGYLMVPPWIIEMIRLTSPGRYTIPVFASDVEPNNLRRHISKIIDALEFAPKNELYRVLVDMQRLIAKLVYRPFKDSKVKFACRRLDKMISTKLRLPDIADELGISYSLFRKMFSEEVGISPGRYQMNRRMECAYYLLATEKMLPQDVADRLEYPDVYSFARQFRKITGLKPEEVFETAASELESA
jgi:AraC-like DNA-binding protein